MLQTKPKLSCASHVWCLQVYVCCCPVENGREHINSTDDPMNGRLEGAAISGFSPTVGYSLCKMQGGAP